MTRSRLRYLALFGAALVAAIGQIALRWWYIEDSAISMAFARNLADGWGLVRFPGEARVEGYSNPLWVFYMAAGYLVGVDGFWSTKLAAGALGSLVSVPLAYVITKRAEVEDHWGWVAAWVLALDAQFVIWSACGLENGLFCALLAIACWRTLREADVGGFPWAAVAFFGLALTRPEGIVYAAFGGLMALVLEASGKRRWGRIAGWLAVFWVPFAAYHAVRFWYFAFEFPATYYSKLEEARFAPYAWNSRSWMYLRKYSYETGRGFFLPVFIIGALSLRGWRGVTAVGLSLWLGAVLVYPGVEPMFVLGWPSGLPVAKWWIALRVVSLGLVAVAVPILALGGKGWRVRVMMWGMALIALGFCVRSTGDWMRGFRWLSLAAVPAAVLFGLGCAEIAGWVQRLGTSNRWRAAGVGVSMAIFVGSAIPEVVYQVRYKPEVGPFSVNRRVEHYAWAMRKLHLEHAEIIDHDMGAMLYWGGKLGIIRDAKGLIDYPFALHHANTAFVREYIYEEQPFDLAHAHASTERAVKRLRRRWQDEYVEFPGYGAGPKPHQGNFVRKSLFIGDAWQGPTEHSATFAGKVTLHGLDVRAPEVQPGSWLFVEFGLETRPRPDDPIRVLAALTREDGEGQVTLDVPLGFEDWYPVTEWKKGEIFLGRVTLPIPNRMQKGTYGIAVVVLGPDGVLPAETVGPAGTLDHEPHYAAGEVYFPSMVRVMAPEKVKKNAALDLDRAVKLGNQTKCALAEEAWEDARAHYMASQGWQKSVKPRVRLSVARCWARAAEKGDRVAAVHAIRRARVWNRIDEQVLQVGGSLADRWYAEGEKAREEGRIEDAYAAYRDALFANPGHAWARRYAEQMRVERLNIR